ncbi:MAG: S41 family peptidase, partial [Pygmaiobacter sp.]
TARSNFYTDISDKTLLDMLGTGYVAGLADKNSKYYTAKQVTEINDNYAGKLMGIGADVVKDASGYFRVVKVYVGSPAEGAGLTKGTIITKLDDTDLKPLTSDAVNALLKGETGTSVHLTYLVDNVENSVDLQRNVFDSPTVEYQLHGSNGYIKILTFAKSTPADMDYAINRLREQGAGTLVFDLRGNTGGKLEYAAECIDQLCPAGAIVSGIYKNGETKVLFTSDADESMMPMVVVTNGTTAAGAELFAASLHDFGKAKIVGAKTAGKGTIQTLFVMSDGSGMDLTVAKLVPGKSESFDGIGVLPDYERVLTPEEELGYYDFTLDDDPQLLRAFEAVSGMAKSTASAAAASTASSLPAPSP